MVTFAGYQKIEAPVCFHSALLLPIQITTYLLLQNIILYSPLYFPVWYEPPTGAKTGSNTAFGSIHTDRSQCLHFQGNETSHRQPIFAMDVVCNENLGWVQGGEIEE